MKNYIVKIEFKSTQEVYVLAETEQDAIKKVEDDNDGWYDPDSEVSERNLTARIAESE
tara:strand:+ start:2248 stop:2421 length:174 start_codon:yes stop_codon:yes gene_type:complete